MEVFIAFVKNLGVKRLVAVGAGVLTFIVLAAVYFINAQSKNMVVLYSDLDAKDSSSIIHELELKEVPFKASNDNAVIKVPQDSVSKVRADLAQMGLPTKAVRIGYEIFDQEENIGTTSFAQNVKMMRALEGELSRTISAFAQVDSARVHLVIPQREVFSREKTHPRASIVLKLQKQAQLSKGEVDAIAHLVVTSVPNLEMRNITIVDTKGKVFKFGLKDEDAENELDLGKNEEYRIAYENRLKEVIESILQESIGVGKVRAHVSVEMSFDKTVVNSEIYDPDGAVPRSVQYKEEKESTNSSDSELDISALNNLPGENAAIDGQGALSNSQKTNQITNYEISRTIKNHIAEQGAIKKISVAVLVDGSYRMNADGQREYIARSEEELSKIRNLVCGAVGFNQKRDDKVEVVNMRFESDEIEVIEDEEDVNWFKKAMPSLVQNSLFAIVVAIILIVVVKPFVLGVIQSYKKDDASITNMNLLTRTMQNRVSVTEQAQVSREQEDEMLESEIPKIKNKKYHGLVNMFNSNPEEFISVIRRWLHEE
ncbi:Flagellar M-ring protein FliF [Rickettsiales endosymbiont of Paramecium tredecaurelia]|uniref:flagellar basal-body MS-ring/collar protein FliF n=1 Tax=Candidatus Sarmatiella mevalonica TaxID=2770581 RepID=UPI001921A235|nr:flagellar basal-body MS-ring/collar protein FliF [Candidatus Sarmatiella mevalonica]MBL3284872.1 Flagellar M-ring protein FliF [Candidatus Sarmatiella mevalonica]